MPNRYIRDAILTSDRYLAVHVHERALFYELVLNADDWGIVPLNAGFLRFRCPSASGLEPSILTRLLSALADVDLIRIYEVADSRFAWIPRNGFQVRARKTKYKLPTDLSGAFNELKELRDFCISNDKRPNANAQHLISKGASTSTSTSTSTTTSTESKTPMSGLTPPDPSPVQLDALNPDANTPPDPVANSQIAIATRVLDALNDATRSRFKPVKATMTLIRARLAEGFSEAECIAVINAKVAEWNSNDKMRAYLRPATLFNATNFANYVGQASAPTPEKYWV